MPLRSKGTGQADKDCFSLSHENEQIQKAVMQKFELMKATTNKNDTNK